MKVRFGLLVLAAALVGSAGCGDDDGVTPTDAGMSDMDSGDVDSGTVMVNCPTGAPLPHDQMGVCCYRASNAAQLTAPELRLAAVKINSPSSLASTILRGLIAGAVDEERFNWLVRIEGAPTMGSGAVTIKTGLGWRDDATSTFAFADNNAPVGMPAMPTDRWNPRSFPGMMDGETFSAMRATEVVTLPIFRSPEDDAGVNAVLIELPLRGLELTSGTLSEDRSCVGRRNASPSYDTSAGDLSAFLTVAETTVVRLDISSIHASLCMLIAGMSSMPGNCDDAAYPRAMWMVKPDSLCTGGTCISNRMTPGTCDPDTTCDAWELIAEFAAQGVSITN